MLTENKTQAAPPRPLFKLGGAASIKHLNVRKEGPDDEKILALDVKLSFSKVDRRLCAFFDDALEAFLWRGDTDALIVRNVFLAPIAYGNEVCGASVQIGAHKFAGCDVKKFSIVPADGGVITLSCSVTLFPSAREVSDLAKLVQDEDSVTIEGPPDLFALDLHGNSDPKVNAVLSKVADIFKAEGVTVVEHGAPDAPPWAH